MKCDDILLYIKRLLRRHIHTTDLTETTCTQLLTYTNGHVFQYTCHIFPLFTRYFTLVFINKQLSYRREIVRCMSYFDSQNCEVEFLSHPFGGA